MAQPGVSSPEPPAGTTNFLRRLFGRGNGSSAPPTEASSQGQEPANGDVSEKPGLMRRVSRKVVPGLPRVQTFKRQQSEKRTNLAPVQPTPAERRAVSVDRRAILSRNTSQTGTQSFPRASAPELLGAEIQSPPAFVPSLPASPSEEPEYVPLDAPASRDTRGENDHADKAPYGDCDSVADTRSITSAQIHDELEQKWILNLSMHFRDKSKREKFFVTYREQPTVWRRVTISLDYRGAPDNSLEMDLIRTKFQRDKSAKIYEAIRESLEDIQFYDTVTNLKLQTTGGRLHVHVVEDVNEIIEYPTVRQVRHLGCRLVRERDIVFDSHMSGFVYKVLVGGEVLIKKEIPGPDTIDEFLYEINALNSLRFSGNVIRFYGLVVDDQEECVKGLLISYADQGALIDVMFDHRQEVELGHPNAALGWPTRARWARQVVQGLSDIHESGFVQGDFTLSNIVIDDQGDAKIIDINRRGCPIGWEPPEATPLIESNQRISMYIGVKSDLYQLGMVLWALAMEEDEPEAHGRPLVLGDEVDVPEWYRQMVEICLSEDPRMRLQATSLLGLFPPEYSDDAHDDAVGQNPPSRSIPEGRDYPDSYAGAGLGYQTNGDPRIRTVSPSTRWTYGNIPQAYDVSYVGYEPPFAYPTRGRSPPRPLPSNPGHCAGEGSYNGRSWSHSGNTVSYNDAEDDEQDRCKSTTPTTNNEAAAAVEKAERHIPEQNDRGQGDEPEPRTDDVKAPASVVDAVVSSPVAVDIRVTVADAEALERASDEQPAPITAHPPQLETALESGPEREEDVPASGEEDNGVVGKANGEADKEPSISPEPGNTEPDVQIDSDKEKEGPSSETDEPGEAIEPVEQAEPTESVEPAKDDTVEIADQPAPASNEMEETLMEEEKGDEKKEAPPREKSPQLPPSSESTGRQSAEALPDTLTGIGAAHDEDNADLTTFTASLEEELGLMGATQEASAQATTGTTDPEK